MNMSGEAVIIISSDSETEESSDDDESVCSDVIVISDSETEDPHWSSSHASPNYNEKAMINEIDDLPRIRRKQRHRYPRPWKERLDDNSQPHRDETPRVPTLPDLPDVLRGTPSDPQFCPKQQNTKENTSRAQIKGQPIRKKRKSMDWYKAKYNSMVGELFSVSDSHMSSLPVNVKQEDKPSPPYREDKTSSSGTVLLEYTKFKQNMGKSVSLDTKSRDKKRTGGSHHYEHHRKKFKKTLKPSHHEEIRSKPRLQKSHSVPSHRKHRHATNISRSVSEDLCHTRKHKLNTQEPTIAIQDNSPKSKTGAFKILAALRQSIEDSNSAPDESISSETVKVSARNTDDLCVKWSKLNADNLSDRHFLDVVPGVKKKVEQVSCDTESITVDLITASESSQDENEDKSLKETSVKTEHVPDLISSRDACSDNNIDTVRDSGVFMREESEFPSTEEMDSVFYISDDDKEIHEEETGETGISSFDISGTSSSLLFRENSLNNKEEKVPLKSSSLLKVKDRNIFDALSDVESLPSITDDTELDMPVLERTESCDSTKDIPVIQMPVLEKTTGCIGNPKTVFNSDITALSIDVDDDTDCEIVEAVRTNDCDNIFSKLCSVKSAPSSLDLDPSKSSPSPSCSSSIATPVKSSISSSYSDSSFNCSGFSSVSSERSTKKVKLQESRVRAVSTHRNFSLFDHKSELGYKSSSYCSTPFKDSYRVDNLQRQVEQLATYLRDYLILEDLNPKVAYMPEVCMNMIHGCEQDEDLNIDHAIKFLEHFSKKYFVPNKIMRHLMKNTLVKNVDKEQYVHLSAKFVRNVDRKYPGMFSVKWKYLETSLNVLSTKKTTQTEKSLALIHLHLLIHILKHDLYSKDISRPREIQRSCAYRLLSSDVGSRNRRELMHYVNQELSEDEDEATEVDADHDNYSKAVSVDTETDRARDGDETTEMGEAIDGAKADIEIEISSTDLPAALQELLSLSIDCSASCVDSANHLARDLMSLYLSLPSLDRRRDLLDSITSQLLKYILIELILESQYCDTWPLGVFPNSFELVVNSFFQATPMINRSSSDVKEMWEGQHSCMTSRDTEELAMLLYYVVESYLRCSHQKSYMALRLRGAVTEGREYTDSEFEHLPKHVAQLEAHLRTLVPELTANTEHYLLLLNCLSDLA